MNQTALIAGITGQDGAYLGKHLLETGYRVVGSSRDAQTCDRSRLRRLGILEDVELISLAPNDFRSVLKALSSLAPAEVYNLAGQTSVGLSFDQPVECMESIAGGTLNFLEVLRYLGAPTRLFSAGSSECFGDTQQNPASETTAFHPRSPYAVAKSTAFWQVANYREAYEANRLIAKGMIDPVISQTFSLTEVGEAAYQVHRNMHEGKIGVLCLAENEGEGVTDHELRAKVGEARLSRFRR